MASKRKSTKKRDPNQITLTADSEKEKADALARTVIRPTVQAAVSLQAFGKELGNCFEEFDMTSLIHSLQEQTEAARKNDLGRGESMLVAQAHTLDAIFHTMARRAALNIGEYLHSAETYLKLALRAQSQCRETWETLSTIKSPPMVGYVKQANIAHGNQQVNNASGDTSRAGENQNLKNELLEVKDGERLDTGTTGTAGRADP